MTFFLWKTAAATIANQLGSLEEVTRLAAQEAEQANRLATTFTKLRNYVYSKRLFHRNGLTVRLGLTDVQLSLCAGAAARCPNRRRMHTLTFLNL